MEKIKPPQLLAFQFLFQLLSNILAVLGIDGNIHAVVGVEDIVVTLVNTYLHCRLIYLFIERFHHFSASLTHGAVYLALELHRYLHELL